MNEEVTKNKWYYTDGNVPHPKNDDDVLICIRTEYCRAASAEEIDTLYTGYYDTVENKWFICLYPDEEHIEFVEYKDKELTKYIRAWMLPEIVN